jgi:two-component system nitrogen regulation response regulator NtrX
VLIVDDDPFVRESLRELLERDGVVALEAGDGKTALEILAQEPVDLLMLDLALPRVSGLNVLREVAARALDLPVVIISGQGSVSLAVTSMKLGARDFIEKPFDAEPTLATVRGALADRARHHARRRTLEEITARYAMCGGSPGMQRVFEQIDRAAPTSAKVLITGESGAGKEMVARAIHALSRRAAGPFVAVNCAAIPEPLIESELFGHVDGAFTGARGDRRGSFELAHGGTLFLDEIADMSLMTQAKILRALEHGEVRPVGGERPVMADFRLIAATHRALPREVEEGNFREDLFYRVGVLTIRVPALRERRDDIEPLATHFLAVSAAAHGVPAKRLSPAALGALAEHEWPGNVRELRNVVERLTLLPEGSTVTAREAREAIAGTPPDGRTGSAAPRGLRDARLAFEREFIAQALAAHAGRVRETAEALGINRSHLWKKMKRLGLDDRSPSPPG